MPNEYAEAGELLKCEALRAVDTAIAAGRNLPLGDDNPVATLSSAMNDMWPAKLSAADVRGLLEQDGELIVRLALRHAQITTVDPLEDDGKFAPGEEQDPSGEAVLMGIGVGVGIKWATYLHLLRHRGPADLRAYLKARRNRRAAGFARELARAFAEVR